MPYIDRVIAPVVLRYLQAFPVVGITGPRQSGKSTLLLHLLPNYEYVTFDDPRMVEFFDTDPIAFMQRYNNRVIFDEIQYVPTIFNYLKMAVDKDRNNYGKFVITGSSQFAMLKNISESLAGRIGLLTLLPFQYSELPQQAINSSIYCGSYPELVLNNYRESNGWYGSYLDTYINKDLRAISNIGDIRDLRRFISLLARNTSQILNLSDYAKDIGVAVTTIKRWISVLEASYIIFLLPPYHKNFGKRIIKSPKVYFYDTGLVSYLTGIETEQQFSKGPMTGSLFENYIILEVIKNEQHNKTNAELYYLRTSNKVEIDLIIDRKSYTEFIEIKSTASFKTKMLDAIKSFIQPKDYGYLIYKGDLLKYSDNITIVNYKEYFDNL